MAKEKQPKQRPDKYAEKVAIKTTFEQTLGIFAQGANKAVKAKQSLEDKVDIVILPKKGNGPKLAIECDGAAYHSDVLSWHHDLYRQQILEKHGFIFHRIWSTNWWRNARGEFRKLVETINTFDNN